MRRLLPVLAGCLLAAGCSMKFAYNNLDTFVRWGINDYLNLTEQQRAYFDAEFARLHQWHRTRHLPLYADFIEAATVTLRDGVALADLGAMEATVRGWGDELEARAMPVAVELLLSLTDDQVARLPKRLEQANRKIAETEEGRSLDQIQRAWVKEYMDAFERFSGRLSREQERYLRAQSVRYVPERVLWADYRRRWQADFVAMLQQRDAVTTFADSFEALAARRESYYGAELAAIFASNEALLRELTAWLLNNLTDAQTERVLERLAELAEGFRELAEQPAALAVGAGQAPAPCLVRC